MHNYSNLCFVLYIYSCISINPFVILVTVSNRHFEKECSVRIELRSDFRENLLTSTSYTILCRTKSWSGNLHIELDNSSNDNSISLCNINIRSIRNKTNFVQHFADEFDILVITESHLDNSIQNDDI